MARPVREALWTWAPWVHLLASAALVVAGVAHIVSIHAKAAAGELAAVTELSLGALDVIGVAIAAPGVIGLAALLPLWRRRRPLPAQLAALAGVLTIAAIVIAFAEPRGLPLLAPPLVDLAFLLPLRAASPSPRGR